MVNFILFLKNVMSRRLMLFKLMDCRKVVVPDPSIDCFNQCEYLPRENNSFSNKVDW